MEEQRAAAMLTKAQRRWIHGEVDYRGSAKRDLMRRIRQRLYNSVLDFSLIAREYPISEIDRSFENIPDGTREPPEESHAVEAMADFFALKYLVHRDLEQEGDAPEGWRMAMDVENGLELALTERLDVDADVSVEIEIKRRGDLETLAKTTDDYSQLTIDQLSKLLKKGYITSDEHAAAWRRKSERGDI
jgi:hypothetical protein